MKASAAPSPEDTRHLRWLSVSVGERFLARAMRAGMRDVDLGALLERFFVAQLRSQHAGAKGKERESALYFDEMGDLKVPVGFGRDG